MLKRIHQHVFLIASVLFALLGFVFLKRLAGESPKVIHLAALIVCCALFSWSAIGLFLEDLERQLNKWLEPKTGGTGSGSVNTTAPAAPYPRRHDLEKSLVHALAPYLVNSHKADDLGAYIRNTADAIMKQSGYHKCLIHGAASCTCRKAFDNLQPNPGAQADQSAEAEIVAAGLTAPRVTKDQIQALMDKLTWRFEQPEGTTSTFAHAFLDRFYLATGHSACVSPENFDAAMGMKYARDQAEGKARDKLWELEGYALAKSLAGA